MRKLKSYGAILGLLLLAIHGCRAEANEKPTEAQNAALLSLSARINNVHTLLAEQEARALRAKREAEFYECKARNERFKAEAAELTASCSYQQAEQARCAAQVEREKGDSSLVGCIAGLGFAAVTGGAAGPLALGGCATGRVVGEMGAKECPLPPCQIEYSQRSPLSIVIAREKLSTLPLCGGRLGLDLEDRPMVLTNGVEIVDAGVLAVAGLSKGDFLAYLNQERVPTQDALNLRLTLERGKEIELRYVRDQRFYVGKAILPKTASVPVNVRSGATATHFYGTRIKGVSPDSPLKNSSVEGRQLLKLDGREVVSTEHLRDLIRHRLAGESVRLEFTGKGRPNETIDVVLVDGTSEQ